MNVSIVKRTCSVLLISTMLTSSLVTKGFAMEPAVHVDQRHGNPAAQSAAAREIMQSDGMFVSAAAAAAVSVHDYTYAPVSLEEVMQVFHDNKVMADVFSKALNKTPAADRNEIGHLALGLIRTDMNTDDVHSIILRLSEVVAERNPFSWLEEMNIMRQLVDDPQTTDIKASFNRLARNYRAEIIGLAKQLIRPDMDSKHINEIIDSLRFEKYSRSYYDDTTNFHANLNIILTSYRAEFVELAGKLIRSDMESRNIGEIISALINVDRSNRAEIAGLTEQLMKLCENDTNVRGIIKSLAMVTSDRAEIVGLVLQLLSSGAARTYITAIISSLNRVASSDRAKIVGFSQQLLRSGINGDQIIIIISSLAKVDGSDRAEIVGLTEQLMKLCENDTNVGDIIKSLAMVTSDRAEIVGLAQQLIRPGVKGYEVNNIISLLADVDSADRGEIAGLAQQLIRQVGNRDACYIIRLFSSISSNRANHVARALLFMHGGNRILSQVFEAPLNDEIRLGGMRDIVQGANPYAAGINVHDGQREARTIVAVERLVGDWQPTQEEIDREFDAFLQAVRALPKRIDQLPLNIQQLRIENRNRHLTLQQRLLTALGVDLNGKRIHQPDRGFGGFLAGSYGEVSIGSLHINAREFIARFWHFANSYVPEGGSDHSGSPAAASVAASSGAIETERAIIRTAIMNGLAEGLQKDSETTDHVVCDPGKIQRLVMGTINGRLRLANGLLVDIDDIGLVNGAKKAASAEEQGAGVGVAVMVDAPMIANLDEISQYLQPFMDEIMGQEPKDRPQNGNAFFMRLFQYRNALADGHVHFFKGQRINLDPAEVVYYVRMMSPATREGGIVRVQAEINPGMSLVELLAYDDFHVDDYMHQFEARDRAQLVEARRIEADRALRAQQDREYAETLENDRQLVQRKAAVTKIQRIARGKLARKHVKTMLTQSQEQARAQAELVQRVTDLRAAIADSTAGAVVADADVLRELTTAEQKSYTRLRNVYSLNNLKK
ncbi:MAG: hypothetical protein V4482_03685 [Pseudomonadota bacterium]